MGAKHEGMFRVAATNVGCLPSDKDDIKHQHFLQLLKATDADIHGISEVGRNWSKTKHSQSWNERMKGEFETLKTSLAWNMHEVGGSSFQWGGTGLLTTGPMVTAWFESGRDPTNLGRWSWSRYRGKEGLILRVVSIYCPASDKGSAGDKILTSGTTTRTTRQRTDVQTRQPDLKQSDTKLRRAAIHTSKQLQTLQTLTRRLSAQLVNSIV
jgi:hypothetical protein